MILTLTTTFIDKMTKVVLSYFACQLILAQLCMRGKSLQSWTLWTVAHQAPRSWDSPGKSIGVGCRALLQGVFRTQGSNLHLFVSYIDRQVLYH